MDEENQLMPGIQFDTVRTFRSRCQVKPRHVSVTPIIVDFRSLLLSKTSTNIVKGVSFHVKTFKVLVLMICLLRYFKPRKMRGMG